MLSTMSTSPSESTEPSPEESERQSWLAGAEGRIENVMAGIARRMKARLRAHMIIGEPQCPHPDVVQLRIVYHRYHIYKRISSAAEPYRAGIPTRTCTTSMSTSTATSKFCGYLFAPSHQRLQEQVGRSPLPLISSVVQLQIWKPPTTMEVSLPLRMRCSPPNG